MNWLQVFGGVLTAIAALLGGYAALKARSIDDKTATREETQQALNAQSALLDRYEKRIAQLETQVAGIRQTADDAVAARNEMKLIHEECDRSLNQTLSRLKRAEARILELEGG